MTIATTIKKKIVKPLRKNIIDTKLIKINYWSLVHLLSGFLLMYVILNLNLESVFQLNKYIILFLFLLVYEIFEKLNVLLKTGLIIPESWKDMVSDLVIGMIGGFIYLNL